MGVRGKLLGVGHHALRAVFQLAQFLATFYGQLVGARHLVGRMLRSLAQLLDLTGWTGNVFGHVAYRLTARFANCDMSLIK